MVTYDIEDDKKRTKISKTLEGYGGTRVQKSVFECEIELKQFNTLKRKLHKFRGKSDSIRYYHLCQRCIKAIEADEPKSKLVETEEHEVEVV